MPLNVRMLIAGAFLLGASGCAQDAPPSAAVQQTTAAPAGTGMNQAIQSLPPDSQHWISKKFAECGGKYQQLSQADRQQLDNLTSGHGRMYFDLMQPK